ncbi:di-heme oxidoredictase family protein [Pseudoxanthomonas putridarboris]|uniref:Di-heme oxidoredictase family protein n=1 Tax=Pseudoxanthomonas putridarboris TaxID=752605 RepID=A0ABU9J234_9GAMM
MATALLLAGCSGASQQEDDRFWVLAPDASGQTAVMAGGSAAVGANAAANVNAAARQETAAAQQNINVDPVPSGRYRIGSVHSGLCVEVAGGSTANGAPLVQAACDGTLRWQFFDITQTATGQYKLVNLHSGKAADIPAGSGANNIVIQQWDDNGTGAQRFRLQRTAVTDRYRIVNVNNGKCFNVAQASTSPGASLEQVTCGEAASQLFHLAPGEPTPIRMPGSQPLIPPPPPVPPSATYQPLLWPDDALPVHDTLEDGTLVTRVGGRVRDRHAREPIVDDSYQVFPPHYFERRTHEILIYDNAVAGDPEQRILTVVVKPQHYWYGTNFRHGFIGRRGDDPLEPTSVALYADNGGMKILPGGVLTRTPIPNYAALGQDPNGNYTPPAGVPGNNFVLVKEIRTAANEGHRPLRKGDLVEFELGIFLAGNPDVIGRFNYYAEALVYRAGAHGIVSWFRGPGYGVQRPLDSLPMPGEALLGGPWMTLHEDTSSEPYRMLMQASHNIASYNMQPWVEGRRLLHTSFVSGLHSEGSNTVFTAQAGKSAPRFSQTRCVDCHAGNGKSSPATNTPLSRLGVFVGTRGANNTQSPDARFGLRLQQGVYREGGANVDGREAELVLTGYTETSGRYGDGTAYVLRKPNYALRDRNGQALALPTALSVRAAPSLVGLGLLEAVPEQALERLAIDQRSDADGVAGRLQIVADPRDAGMNRVGRFGWKAGAATLEQQTSLAFNTDLGVTSPLMSQLECARGSAGAACAQVDNGSARLTAADIHKTTLYLSLLGVPPRRSFDNPLEQNAQARQLQAVVKRGQQMFEAARCTACHVPALRTGHHQFVELRYQDIKPYTDLLLHDMGPGLADTYVEGRATGSEWRTAPLWGLGTAAAIDPSVRYLHDGRAATLEEAILWHGGQASAAKQRFEAMPLQDRRALVEFLKSL